MTTEREAVAAAAGETATEVSSNGSSASPRQLERAVMQRLLQSENVSDVSVTELVQLFRDEDAMVPYLPDGRHQVDPRDGAVVVFNPSRARRPHDGALPASDVSDGPCPICDGNTTGIVDVTDLSEGFTFINKNLFPILRVPDDDEPLEPEARSLDDLSPEGGAAHGLHFLQWTSSLHDRDWHNMPVDDRVVVLERLAALERTLLNESAGFMPSTASSNGPTGTNGYVSVIKNHGRPVGGSLSHGHQQIAFSNVMPRRVHSNLRFEERRGESFSAYMQRENPPELTVRDYGAAMLVVPYFMRRPYDMTLLVRDVSKQNLSDLTAQELAAVADGWHDAAAAAMAIMPRIGREPAFNVTVNSGPGAGLYIDFLPYTQETGGFEHLGLWVCQDSPTNVRQRLVEQLGLSGSATD